MARDERTPIASAGADALVRAATDAAPGIVDLFQVDPVRARTLSEIRDAVALPLSDVIVALALLERCGLIQHRTLMTDQADQVVWWMTDPKTQERATWT